MIKKVKSLDLIARTGEDGSKRPSVRALTYKVVDYSSRVKYIRFILKEYIQGTEK